MCVYVYYVQKRDRDGEQAICEANENHFQLETNTFKHVK